MIKIDNIDRGHIYVTVDDRHAVIPGEMFTAKDEGMGFAVTVCAIDFWEPKSAQQRITPAEIDLIVDGLKEHFQRHGHTLELE